MQPTPASFAFPEIRDEPPFASALAPSNRAALGLWWHVQHAYSQVFSTSVRENDMNRILKGALMLELISSTLPAPALAADAGDCCQIVELRQYVTYPGKRDALIKLFESNFIESQEALGIRILGTFRDLNDPHHFTWLRGFSDMEARRKALSDFYFDSPVWKAHRDEANATLFDNDDVLLLHPATPGSGFVQGAAKQAPVGASGKPGELVVATIYYFAHEVPATFAEQFNRELMPVFERNGARIVGRFVSDKSKNTFERLPVREDVNVFVWLASFPDRDAYGQYQGRLAQDAAWRDTLFARLYKSLQRQPETLLLEPTARSLLR